MKPYSEKELTDFVNYLYDYGKSNPSVSLRSIVMGAFSGFVLMQKDAKKEEKKTIREEKIKQKILILQEKINEVTK